MSKKSIKYMILIRKNISDNLIIMWGKVFRIILFFTFAFLINTKAYALEKIGIITDTILTPVNYYNAYFKTPEFFAVDIKGELSNKGVEVISIDSAKEKLKKAGLRQYDFEYLQGLQQGYNTDFTALKKIAKIIGVKKLVIVTMGIDVQRDFLKNTMWNMLNVPGMDVVNPTHRVNVWVGFVDVDKETMLWESIYAKNIRNNKLKNLDTTISNNYEGMLRLKEYSKYISPDIAYNVKMKLLNPNYVEPPTYITRENIKQYAKDKHNIGSKKELSEIDRQKWDYDKLINDTKQNTINVTNATKTGIVNTSLTLKDKFINFKNKKFKKKNADWL